jgi:peptidoglycan hydrolase-like protein with peptidoglycan-binding domain
MRERAAVHQKQIKEKHSRSGKSGQDKTPAGSLTRSQGTMIDLQNQIGNRAVNQLVHSPGAAVQRQPGPATETIGVGAPLVGLRRGDGLDLGTEDTRPRVSLLQEKLNEKMMAALKVDGMFGPLTETALREFQESEGLEPQPFVDQETADLLMMDRREEDNDGEDSDQPDPEIKTAGERLKSASQSTQQAASEVIQAGTSLATSLDIIGRTAGLPMIQGGIQLFQVAEKLRLASIHFESGESGLPPAGVRIQEASPLAVKSAAEFISSGVNLSAATSAMMVLAGQSLIDFGEKLRELAALLESAGIKLSSEQGGSRPIGDPLVGLARGDGLVFGTWHRRPRVRLLQSTLNDRSSSGLAVDGMFGPLTGQALTEFQVSVPLPPGERVDRPTAQALRGAEAGGTSGHSGAGKDLQEAGTLLTNAAASHLATAGGILTGSMDTGERSGGVSLIQATGELIAAGMALAQCGISLGEE